MAELPKEIFGWFGFFINEMQERFEGYFQF